MLYFIMKLYIVRHGSTLHLENKQRQTKESSLSQQGLVQVKKIGQRLTGFEIDLFLASPLKRSDETAETISKLIKVEHTPDERLSEIDYSEELRGVSLTDEINKRYDREKLNRLDNLDWKFLNEGESLRDVVERTTDFKKELVRKHIDENILVVSHAYAIRCLIAGCILGDNYREKTMLRVFHAIRISKASLSILEYKPENKYFYVHLLNDTTHLDNE